MEILFFILRLAGFGNDILRNLNLKLSLAGGRACRPGRGRGRRRVIRHESPRLPPRPRPGCRRDRDPAAEKDAIPGPAQTGPRLAGAAGPRTELSLTVPRIMFIVVPSQVRVTGRGTGKSRVEASRLRLRVRTTSKPPGPALAALAATVTAHGRRRRRL